MSKALKAYQHLMMELLIGIVDTTTDNLEQLIR